MTYIGLLSHPKKQMFECYAMNDWCGVQQCLLALLPGVPGVPVPEHHHELGHPHHGAVGGAQHRARAQQRPAAERVETSQAEMGCFGLSLWPG